MVFQASLCRKARKSTEDDEWLMDKEQLAGQRPRMIEPSRDLRNTLSVLCDVIGQGLSDIRKRVNRYWTVPVYASMLRLYLPERGRCAYRNRWALGV